MSNVLTDPAVPISEHGAVLAELSAERHRREQAERERERLRFTLERVSISLEAIARDEDPCVEDLQDCAEGSLVFVAAALNPKAVQA
jgi:hypothetical protein